MMSELPGGASIIALPVYLCIFFQETFQHESKIALHKLG
jgi:hypothetical protein